MNFARKIWIGSILLLASILAGMLITVARADETIVTHAVTQEVLAQAKQQIEQAPPSLKEQATQVLQGLINAAVQTGEFIKEQVPIVVKELLAFSLAEDIFWILVGTAILVVGEKTRRYCWRKSQIPANRYDSWEIPAFASSLVSFAAALPILGCNILDILKITLAPRVWLLEYAAHLVK